MEPFVVTGAVHTVVAQRLIRSICPNCRVEQPTPVNRLIQLGISSSTAKQMKMFKGVGCDNCSATGYAGRFAVFEAMRFTQSLKEAVLTGSNSLELKKLAMEEGMRTLRMNSLRKVAEGRTTLEEALANTANDF